ncbi:uncharacterized protein BDZ99DRAFT_465559 [Mytilinidion resinicola]|uniref:Uncharacterized protein n=1 Tax=Mytilinidion resinicola TaxID=574789 RepID=A0A6A6YD63_9PEZI|nr:uncharacterized protein BDZ99DRAFT_465559 [Mytilinidion resinicola]KAF2806766.1 hypothetical protein BDZ99DRAFT_465559 [Mytilinidion resinicola]
MDYDDYHAGGVSSLTCPYQNKNENSLPTSTPPYISSKMNPPCTNQQEPCPNGVGPVSPNMLILGLVFLFVLLG